MLLEVGEKVLIFDCNNQLVETLILTDGKLDPDIYRDLPAGFTLKTKKYCFLKGDFGMIRTLFSVCQRCEGLTLAGKSCGCPGS